MFRVIATDLDGTLLTSEGEVSERTLRALQACSSRGMRIVVATGRAPLSAARVLPEGFPDGVLACYNGAEIHENGEIIARNCLSPELAREIVRVAEPFVPDAPISVAIDGEWYCNRLWDTTLPLHIVDLHSAITRPVAKIICWTRDVTDLGAFQAALPTGCRLMVTSGGVLCEIVTETASKAWALRYLTDKWGLSMSDVIAFGDDANDIEMIREAGLGVAVSNAIPEVRAAADLVVPSNDEAGVAHVLESLLTRYEP